MSFDPIKIYPTKTALIEATAHRIANIAAATLQHNDVFSIALSGGSTPEPVYERLAQEYAGSIDWSRIHLFFGDERAVAPDDEQSNYAMVKAALIDHIDIPDENIHRMRGEDDPQAAAKAYETEIKQFFGEDAEQLFDLNLLGMGDDGHTASLFPDTDAVHEDKAWVIAHHVEKVGMYRITLSPLSILKSCNIMFLISGANKADALYEVMEGDKNPDTYPSQVVVRSNHEHIVWMLDEAAAVKIKK